MSGFSIALSPLRSTGLQGFCAAFKQAWVAIETRRHLAEMDDRMLRDVGLTRAEALREADRAPWDLTPRDRAPALRR